ncbi:MAG: energy transducer TonB [Deltaproteobacteria bacterium]|nr:energy transducer TonB [Deltaproteobacteria bacterium]
MVRKFRITIDGHFSMKTMRVWFTASLLIHVILILMIQKAFPVNWFESSLRTYHVELLRPPLDHLAARAISGAGLDTITPPEKPEGSKAEETVSLDNEDKRYSSYLKIIKDRLAYNWQYPRFAWENLMEGNVMVMFRLDMQGNLMNIEIQHASGFAVLDDEVARAIRISSPFPPFPDSVTAERLNIVANFTYQIAAHQ